MENTSDGIGPSRRPSATASSIVSVPTPSRDLSFRRGAYTKNILRLEQSAEEMSAGGSDIGEEIRRMNEAERSRSRGNSSVHSWQHDDASNSDSNNISSSNPVVRSARSSVSSRTAPRDVFARSRTESGNNNSILDVNSNARVGGYSPSGFVTSPTASIRSGSWSGVQKRESTGSKRSSRLANTVHADFGDAPLDLSFDSFPARQMSEASYTRGDDGAAASGADHVDGEPVVEDGLRIEESPSSSLDLHNEHAHGDGLDERPASTDPPPERPNSSDTFRQAQDAFEDFDGVHYSPETDEFVELDHDGNEVRRVSAKSSSAAGLSSRVPSMLLAPHAATMAQGAPPPPDGMVFYPAPVPRMLNLPKRLSQLPAAGMQSKRRTQPLAQLPEGSRASAAWLPSHEAVENGQSRFSSAPARTALNERLSVANFSNVPPQLRASVFFEHQTVVHDVEVEAESAVATLDNILAASATAPVGAFTDHLYVGDTSKTSYAQEKIARRSTANDLRMSALPAPHNNRSSVFTGLLKRASSSNLLGGTLQTKASRNTLLDPTQPSEYAPVSQHLAGNDDDDLDGRRSSRPLDEAEQIEQDFIDEEEREDIDEDDDAEPHFAQPTTLLAELQVRKAQQKSRNRTAATAFPNGMHSTLLQMDAVAEIDKKKRSNQRVALVWEDPSLKVQDAANEVEDEEVPLGMLFPNKNGLAHRKLNNDDDWNRPLGLMEKREMEDNEPLSSRRSRLRGEPIQRRRQHSPAKLAVLADDAEEGDGDDETLAQRSRRISSRIALDGAIEGLVPKDGSRPLSTFTNDVLGEFASGLDNNAGANQAQPAEDIENETLGQRKARLRREREAAERPALQQRNSMSNLLSANPIGERRASRHQHVPMPGTLLHASAQALADNKRNLFNANANSRNSSYGSQRPPLVNSHSAATLQSAAYMQQHQPMFTANAGFGMYPSASTPNMFAAQANSGYFASPNMAMQMQMQAQMNPLAYNMLAGQSAMYPTAAQMGGMGGMGMMGYNPAMPQAYGFSPDGITVQQRAAIDRWRASVMQ